MPGQILITVHPCLHLFCMGGEVFSLVTCKPLTFSLPTLYKHSDIELRVTNR